MKTIANALAQLAVLSLLSISARAAAPAYVPLQGVLTDANGTPITSAVDVHFALFDAQTGGTQLWSETQSIAPQADGLFVAYLGEASSLDLVTFRDHGNVWLEISVATHPAMPRVDLGSTPFAGFAQYCGPHSGQRSFALWLGERASARPRGHCASAAQGAPDRGGNAEDGLGESGDGDAGVAARRN
jgi:hypothetical protein